MFLQDENIIFNLSESFSPRTQLPTKLLWCLVNLETLLAVASSGAKGEPKEIKSRNFSAISPSYISKQFCSHVNKENLLTIFF